MLRREADGVGWHVARAAAKGRAVPAPMLGLFWTSVARPACGDAVRQLVVEGVEGEFARLGIPLRRLMVTGIDGGRPFTDSTLDRPFKEPGTAFREIPLSVMAHAPVFEDDVVMGDDD
ncbi:hypothetical protein [Embleya sp. NPDC020630]|uniref:hypothetical protein n=1 Tax=Embleya sp. NPDC020630 TaxID=3363979 RepID=UPI003789D562